VFAWQLAGGTSFRFDLAKRYLAKNKGDRRERQKKEKKRVFSPERKRGERGPKTIEKITNAECRLSQSARRPISRSSESQRARSKRSIKEAPSPAEKDGEPGKKRSNAVGQRENIIGRECKLDGADWGTLPGVCVNRVQVDTFRG